MENSITKQSWLLLTVLGLIWGSTFMIIELALDGITPSLVARPGMMVWYGRFNGASTLGCSVDKEKLEPLLCNVNPHPLGTIQEPKPM